MNVSPKFSPPISLMKPYFTLSGWFYLLSMILAFFIDPTSDIHEFFLLGWVHLYMLGFVMLSIFAAMAQLGPIVIEKNHYNAAIFRYLYLILVGGLILLLYGFFVDMQFLLYGGAVVLVAMISYAVEFLLTLKADERKTSITKAMKMSNLFLLLGIITGLVMAAAFNNLIDLNPHSILQVHTFGLLVGFVILLIMGISIILIPMFGTAKRISDNEFSSSFITLSLGVVMMMLSVFFQNSLLQNAAYLLSISAILIYFYQLYKMLSSRARIINDIWTHSIYVAFGSFALAFVLLCVYLLNPSDIILKTAMWILFVGFFGFVIIGNFYKIIPFLVWFHIYSPLIETQSVPMLHELLKKKRAHLAWFYSLCGLTLSSVGVFLEDSSLFKGGVVLLIVGGFLVVWGIKHILWHKI